MKQHNRLGSYLAGEQTTISTEGLWDDIKKLFDAKAPDPRVKEKDGKKVYEFSWVPTFKKEIEKTYGNLDWVKRHHHPREVHAPKLAVELSYKRRLPATPMDVLSNARDIALQHYKQNNPALEAYNSSIEKLDTEMAAFYAKTGDGHKTAVEMAKRAKALPRPFRKGTVGPEWLGGLRVMVVGANRRDHETTGVVPTKGYHVNGNSLPQLSPEQIVEAAKAMLDAVDTLAKIEYPWAGSGCDTELWSELYDSEEDLMSEAYGFMYFQDAPEEQADYVALYLGEWGDILYKVARWLHTQVTEEDISLESLDLSPMALRATDVMSMEAEGGVFGLISKGIKMLTKGFKDSEKSPDPHNMTGPDGKRIWSSDWLDNALKVLPQTWSNPEWVANNLNSHDVQAAKIATALSYKGKVPATPVEAMKNAERVSGEVFAKYTPPIRQYADQIRAIEKQAAVWFKQTDSSEETAERMIAAMRKLKNPIPSGFTSPEMLGGIYYTVTDAMYDVGPRDNYRADGSRLRALTADQIVEASKLLEEHILKVKEGWKKMIAVGSSCDSGVWGSLEYNEELWDLFYFQAEPDAVESVLSEPLFVWLEALLNVAKWIHSQVTSHSVSLESLGLPCKHTISLESNGPRLAQYFDDKPKAARSDQRAALFGTVESDWRAVLEDKLDCAVFNPVVDHWDEKAQAQEELVKKTASALVFCITPKQTGFYSFVEITGAAIRTPERVFVCFLADDEGTTWPEKQKASIDATKTYLNNECGITVYETLDALAEAINAEVEPISANGSLKDTDNAPTPSAPEGGL